MTENCPVLHHWVRTLSSPNDTQQGGVGDASFGVMILAI
jgi:hypothetical protein